MSAQEAVELWNSLHGEQEIDLLKKELGEVLLVIEYHVRCKFICVNINCGLKEETLKALQELGYKTHVGVSKDMTLYTNIYFNGKDC